MNRRHAYMIARPCDMCVENGITETRVKTYCRYIWPLCEDHAPNCDFCSKKANTVMRATYGDMKRFGDHPIYGLDYVCIGEKNICESCLLNMETYCCQCKMPAKGDTLICDCISGIVVLYLADDIKEPEFN